MKNSSIHQHFGQLTDPRMFEQFLDLSAGIPSHDTFCRVFSLLEPKEFMECFTNWVKPLAKKLKKVRKYSAQLNMA